MVKPPQTAEDVMNLAHTDPRYLIERTFSVINKDKDPVPFIFNTNQNLFYDVMTTRDDILKGSQLGFSTMILGILTVKFLLVPNAWCVCISHEGDATRRLFEKVDFFLKTLPPEMKQFLELEKDTSTELINKKMNSRFYIGTAGSRAFGRGDTIHYAHLSEVSRWPDAGNIATGIIRAVPLNDPKTWIVKETTANGQGNWHHTEWMREMDKQSSFRPHFIKWFKDDGYKIPGAVIDPTTLNDDERRLRNMYPEDLTDDRIAWMRQMIGQLPNDKGYTPEQLFKQEFPSTWQEAFLFSGNPFFPVEQTQRYIDNAREPLMKGNLQGVDPFLSFNESPQGYSELYEMPEADGQYLIGADMGKSSSWAVATVINKKTWEIVAKYRAKIEADVYGDDLNVLGRFYNDALIAVEYNNQGVAVINKLKELKYPHLYNRVNESKATREITEQPGWHTNATTRPAMLGYLQGLILKEQIGIPDKKILDEMRTFIRHDNGDVKASEGNNDDCVIATAIAYYVLRQFPFIERLSVANRPTNTKLAAFKNYRGGGAKKSGFRLR